ncbi:MAG: HAMP domain-containing histidine kinase [Bacteroidia bacterium]|nr:HAMP domain-containing histidine kinase [Bacteroidia bacterium]
MFFIKHFVHALPVLEFSKTKNIQLNQLPWDFYYNSTYEDIKNNPKIEPVKIDVPGNWANLGLPSSGYGTYVFKFRHDQPHEKCLAIKMYTVACSYDMFINGKLTRSAGVFSIQAQLSKADFHPNLTAFTVNSDTIEIAIQVSNYQYRNGGLWFSPAIGIADSMEVSDKRNIIIEAFLIGALLLLFSYFVVFYYIKTADKTSLFFALMCLFAALRIGSTGEIIFRQLSFGLPWELIVKFEFASLAFMLIFGFYYLNCLFPRDFNAIFFKAIQLVHFVIAFIFIVTPVYYSSYFIPYYLFYCGFLLAYMFNLIIKINMVKRPFAIEVGAATFLVVLAGINDIFYSQAQIKTFYAMPLGILIYAIIQAMVITRMFSNAFRKVEDLSAALIDVNKNQQEIIENRTSELNKNTHELEQSNQIKDKVFSIIAHDLRAPIKSLSTVLAWVAEDDLTYEELKKSLSSISKNVDTLNLTLENLLQWSRSQLNGVKSEPELVDIRKPIQEMIDLFKIQLSEKGLHLIYDNTQRHAVFVDKHHLNLLFRNILSNAIKFSHAGGNIEIKASNYGSKETLIEIIDTGIGMNQEALDKVFSATEHYSTYGTKNERGTGLGLLLCKEYVENGGGKIWIESKEGEGTKISFILPNSGS